MTLNTNLSVPLDRIPPDCQSACILRGTGSKKQKTTYSIGNDFTYVDYYLAETHPGTYKTTLTNIMASISITDREINSFLASGNTGVEGSYSIFSAKVGGTVNNDRTETTVVKIENSNCRVLHALVSGGKEGLCCCGDVSSFALHILLKPKNCMSDLTQASSTNGVVLKTSSTAENTTTKPIEVPQYLDLLKKETKVGVYLVASCKHRTCADYAKKKLIFGGKVDASESYEMPSKIFTTLCPCCKNSGTFECSDVGIKGSKWKWEGAKKTGSVTKTQSGEWDGDQIKNEIINLTGWQYFTLTQCE